MTSDTNDAIRALREIANPLNEATTDAANTVRAVEDFLGQLHIGLPCEIVVDEEHVRVPDEDDESNGEDADDLTLLAYERYGPRYRIVVKRQRRTAAIDANNCIVGDRFEDLVSYDWLSAPRELKLSTFGALPDLLKAISEKANDAIGKTADTSETVGEIMQALQGGDA